MAAENSHSSLPTGQECGKPSSSQNSLQIQFSYFQIDEKNDTSVVKQNKLMITKLMNKLEKKGLLVAETIKDYQIISSLMNNCIHKVVEKKEFEGHLNVNGTYYGAKYLALRTEEIPLTNSLILETRRSELLPKHSFKTAILAEKVFFDFDEKNSKYTINYITPWIRHTLVSWILKSNDSQTNDCVTFSNNKRRFEEVRRVLTAFLEGISTVHHLGRVLLNINPQNLLINEYWDKSTGERFGNQEFSKVLMTQPIVRDFRNFKDLTNPKSIIPAISEYAAPEIMRKEPVISPKADIYSFGMILYKIFVNESGSAAICRETNPLFQISKENIKKRIAILFPFDIKSERIKNANEVDEAMIEDIAQIINYSLSDVELRPQASKLLLQHKFFKLSQSTLLKVNDFEIQNTFEYGLKLMEGTNDCPKDLKKAREVFETMSNSFKHAPSDYFLGFMLHEGLGLFDENLGHLIMKQSASKARKYFESHEDSLGFSEFALGYMFQSFGGEFHPSKAYDFLNRSCNKGNSFAQSLMGNICENKGDYPEAVRLYTNSSDKGNCKAQSDLARMLTAGKGVEKDYSKGLKLHMLSAVPNETEFPVDNQRAVHFLEEPKDVVGVEDPEQPVDNMLLIDQIMTLYNMLYKVNKIVK